MNTVRTVSDAKRTFYEIHTRPVNSIYRRVVDELMVEMHLLAVSVDFRYDPIYALGVATAFDRFMQGYRPDPDKASIFTALCRSVESDPQQIRQDAQQILSLASHYEWEILLPTDKPSDVPEVLALREKLRSTVVQPKFKYSRLFAIGLLTLLETAHPTLTKQTETLTKILKEVCQALQLPEDKLQKDLDLYRSNLEKMVQAQTVMADLLAADRKKREERSQMTSPTDDATDATPNSEVIQDEAR